MTVTEFLILSTCITTGPGYEFQAIRPRVRCKDGYTVSIQASKNSYCRPQINSPSGLYSEVELGYPSKADYELSQYAESKGNLTGSVYGYVPIYIIEKVCRKHRGIVDIDMSNLSITNMSDKEFDMINRLRKELRKNFKAYNEAEGSAIK